MAAKNLQRRKLAASVGANTRWHGDTSAYTALARRDTAVEAVAESLTRLFESEPLPTREQRTRLLGIIAWAGGHRG